MAISVTDERGNMNPEWIRDLRHRAGMSRAEFAVRLGVSYESICSWEQGRRVPTRLAMARLLEFGRMLEQDRSKSTVSQS